MKKLLHDLTVDIVLIRFVEKLEVLLIKRKSDPFKGMRALPWGFVHDEEDLDDAAYRKLKQETAVKDVYLEQLYTFGDKKRDPRWRFITISYMWLTHFPCSELDSSKANHVNERHDIYNLPKLAFDHKKIIACALGRLKNKLAYSNVAQHLLPPEFPLSELQELYEISFTEVIDKRNFRKKILSLDLLEETENKLRWLKQRPAQLYRFKEKTFAVKTIFQP